MYCVIALGVKGRIMDFKNIDISDELRAEAKACKSPEELIALAKREGYKLSDQDLEVVSGGQWMGCSSASCDDYSCGRFLGETRESIDSALVHSDFVNGVVDGGELD